MTVPVISLLQSRWPPESPARVAPVMEWLPPLSSGNGILLPGLVFYLVPP